MRQKWPQMQRRRVILARKSAAKEFPAKICIVFMASKFCHNDSSNAALRLCVAASFWKITLRHLFEEKNCTSGLSLFCLCSENILWRRMDDIILEEVSHLLKKKGTVSGKRCRADLWDFWFISLHLLSYIIIITCSLSRVWFCPTLHEQKYFEL